MKWIVADLDLNKNLSSDLWKKWKLIMIEKFLFRALIHWTKMWVVNRYLGVMVPIVVTKNEKLNDRGAKVRR